MADTKISALTAATTPLAGTEVLPIVQSGTTKKVAVSDLTAGRAVSGLSFTSTSDSSFAGLTVGLGASAIATNSAIGVSALRVVTTGAKNTSAGYQAGYNVSSSPGNAFFGYKAGYAQTTGITYGSNTFVGAEAGLASTSDINTFIGAGSGYLMTSGQYNTILGAFSGNQGGLDIRTSDSYIVLSDGSGNPRLYSDGSGNITVKAGNVIQGTAAKGINFTANSGAAGMTSQLLNWYEEGTFTPTVQGTTTAGTASYDFRIARYTRIGRMVQIEIAMQWNSGTGTGNLIIAGLPFTNAGNYTSLAIGRTDSLALTAGNIATAYVEANATTITLRQYPTGGGSDSAIAYDAAALMFFSGCYSV